MEREGEVVAVRQEEARSATRAATYLSYRAAIVKPMSPVSGFGTRTGDFGF